MLRIFKNKKLWHRKWQFFNFLVCNKKIMTRIKCIPIVNEWWWQLFHIWFLSNHLGFVNHIFYVWFLSNPLGYVPKKWLPLVNSWSLWNYTLAEIFNHFNCSISITISLTIASKGQLTTSQLLHSLQSVTSHHVNQWWASMMHIQASVDLSGYTL